MFFAFLGAAAIAPALIQLGALSVWVTVLAMALKATSLLLLAAVLYAIALHLQRRHHQSLINR